LGEASAAQLGSPITSATDAATVAFFRGFFSRWASSTIARTTLPARR
jgi:hypothetical protein